MKLCSPVLLLVFAVLLGGSLGRSDSESWEVSTSGVDLCPKLCNAQGCLVGQRKVGNVVPYEAYFGIPYAAPPVGKLRFKRPAPPKRFRGTWDSTYHRPPCMQNSLKNGEIVIGSEDCLYLNVYRPELTTGKKKLLPVLVFFHGGSFKFGGSHPKYYSPDYLMDNKKMIFVSVQYRLGVFGFLASGDSNCKGNFGLKDQNMALQWIQENIQSFGGDPDEVTLMGEDSGAVSTHFHMMSRASDDLFKKAILVSGTALTFNSYNRDPVEQFQQFATIAGIGGSNSRRVVEKLRELPAEAIQIYSNAMPSFHIVSKVFRPVIEGTWSGAFMTRDPHTIWKSGKYQQRSFRFMDMSYAEGAFADLYLNKTKRNQFVNDFANSVSSFGDIPKEAQGPIRKYFFGNSPSRANIHNITVLFGHWAHYYPVYKTALMYTKYGDQKKNPMDFLFFGFNNSFSLSSLTNPYPVNEMGASQTDAFLYLFPYTAFADVFKRGPAENRLKDLMVWLLSHWMRKGPHRLENYDPHCSYGTMIQQFCDYPTIIRTGPEDFLYTTTDEHDMEAVRVLKQVDAIMGIDY